MSLVTGLHSSRKRDRETRAGIRPRRYQTSTASWLCLGVSAGSPLPSPDLDPQLDNTEKPYFSWPREGEVSKLKAITYPDTPVYTSEASLRNTQFLLVE